MEENSMPKIVVGPRLRPVGSQLKDSFTLIYKHWAPLLVTQAIIFFTTILIIVAAVVTFMMPVALGLLRGMGGSEILDYVFSGYFWFGIAVIFIAVTIIGSWGYAAMIAALGYRGGGMAPIGYSLKRGFQLLLPFFILTLVTILAYVGSFFLLIFPVIILVVGLSLAWYIIVLEDVSVLQAIGTSWEIVRGYKWSIFGRLLLLAAIIWGVAVALAVWNVVPIMGLAAIPFQFIFNFIVTPYALAYFYCIYDDIRSGRQDVYPMRGGIAVLMIVSWIVGALVIIGVIMLATYLIQTYMV